MTDPRLPDFDTMTPADFEKYLPDFFANGDGHVSTDPRLQTFLKNNPDCAALVRRRQRLDRYPGQAEAARPRRRRPGPHPNRLAQHQPATAHLPQSPAKMGHWRQRAVSRPDLFDRISARIHTSREPSLEGIHLVWVAHI